MNPLLPATCKIIYDKEFVEVQNTNKELTNLVDEKEKKLKQFYDFAIQHMYYILEKLPQDMSSDLINYLSKCKCCSRHQKNRPTTLIDNYEDYPASEESLMMMNDENYVVPERCKCKCRHIIRILNKLH